MNSIAVVFDHMHTDDAQYSRWSYSISDARSEPLPPQRPRSQIVPPSLPTPSPPPPSKARIPIQITPGVWVEDQTILYSSEYPPVQKYLEETRKQRTFLRPPSEVILALAALDVAEHPEDPAHWIIWNLAYFNDIQERVDKVFSEQPKRIKTRVPWQGKYYRPTLVSRQLKYECVHIQHRWYPTEVGEKTSTAADTRRATRSSGTTDETDITAAQYFNLFPNKPHLLKEHTSKPVPPASKRKRSATKRKPPTKRVPKATVEEDTPFEKRTSTRVRRKISASDRSPRILSSAVANPPSMAIDDSVEASSSSSLADSTSSAPTHTRTRSSSSQASNDTLVQSARSPSVSASVTSATTAVGTSSPKKRKAIELEEEDVEVVEPTPPKRMATRGRPPKVPPIDSEKGSTSSRTSTPAVDSKAKLSRPNARAKKARAS